MAMEEIIARFGMDATGFSRGVATATNSLQRLSGVAANLQRILAGTLAAKLVNDAIKFGSAISDAAEATQTSIEGLQVLQYAARESGVDVAKLNAALVKTTTSAMDAARGVKEQASAFRILNIDVTKFLDLPTEERLEALGRAWVESGKSVYGFDALTTILGEKSGPKLLEMLEKLATDGFAEVKKEAIAAGNVLSELDVQTLDNLGDSIDRWKTSALVAIGEVVSAMQRFSNWNAGDTPEQRARAQARAEVINKRIPGGAMAATPGGNPRIGAYAVATELTQEERAQIEARTQEILTNIAKEAAEARARDEIKAAEHVAKTKIQIAEDEAEQKRKISDKVFQDEMNDLENTLRKKKQAHDEAVRDYRRQVADIIADGIRQQQERLGGTIEGFATGRTSRNSSIGVAASRVQRLESDAQRWYERAARESGRGNVSEAQRWYDKALGADAEVKTLRNSLPGLRPSERRTEQEERLRKAQLDFYEREEKIGIKVKDISKA